jgi:hypothetical protein
MSYDADISKVMEKFNAWGSSSVIGEDEFREVDGLMQRHRDDRGRQFEECINALKRTSDIQSAFDNACDKGLDLSERLATAVSAKVTYAGSYGFGQAGFGSFFAGETIAWQTCKGGRIGLIAEAMHDIEVNNVEIFKKLEEDLKKCREEAAVVDELSRKLFKEWQTTAVAFAREVAGNVAGVKAGAIVVSIPKIGTYLVPLARDLVRTIVGGNSAIGELAKRKAAAKAIIDANDKLVIGAQAQIGDSAIEDIRKRAEEIAKSWKEATRNDSTDWENFGKACIEAVNEKAARAREKAQKLYDDMHPLYLEALKNSFVSILIDSSSLASSTGELDSATSKMFDELAQQSDQVALLRDSDPKRNAVADMETIKSELTNALTDLKRRIAEDDALMKK